MLFYFNHGAMATRYYFVFSLLIRYQKIDFHCISWDQMVLENLNFVKILIDDLPLIQGEKQIGTNVDLGYMTKKS